MAALTVIPLPPTEYLRKCFSYDPDTGVLTWQNRPREHFASDGSWRRWNTCLADKPAGGIGPGGYMVVEIKARPYRVHRVIWKLQTGTDPREEIDHKNLDKTDNRWTNLREATPQQNCFNRPKTHKTNGLPVGVYLNRGRYVSYARAVPGEPRAWLGGYDTPEGARAAYLAFVLPRRGEFS